jgi:hypothetical protein
MENNIDINQVSKNAMMETNISDKNCILSNI